MGVAAARRKGQLYCWLHIQDAVTRTVNELGHYRLCDEPSGYEVHNKHCEG